MVARKTTAPSPPSLPAASKADGVRARRGAKTVRKKKRLVAASTSVEFYKGIDNPPIFVDDRAGSKELATLPATAHCCELVRLSSGDVCFTGNGPQGIVMVGIELKSIYDLISSMETGRLQATQIPAMLKEYDHVWLLYYGRYRPNHTDGTLEIMGRQGDWRTHRVGTRAVPYGYLEGFLISLTDLGVHIKHVTDIEEAAAWIGVAARRWNKPWGQHRSMQTFDRSQNIVMSPGTPADVLRRAQVAAGLPGLGYKRAVAAAHHFSSIGEMLMADKTEWMKIEGVGKGIAEAVTTAIWEVST